MVLAELRDHRLLAFLHDEEPRAQPDQHRHTGDQPDANARRLGAGVETGASPSLTTTGSSAATTLPAAEQTAKLAVEVAPELIQVGRPLVRTTGALAALTGAIRLILSLWARPLLRRSTFVITPTPTWIVQVEHARHAALQAKHHPLQQGGLAGRTIHLHIHV